MKILGIETSCDETAAAVVEDGVRIMSNVVVSQIDVFAEYGGVIPEVAARSHLEVILPVIDKALSDASCSWDDIDAIAVTHAPGLLGSLLIGTLTARTLAVLHNKPLYAVHHLKSHVYANWLDDNGNQNNAFSTHSSRPVDLNWLDSEPESVHFGARPAGPSPWAAGATPRAAALRTPFNEQISGSLQPIFPLLALVVSGGHTQILYMPEHNRFEIIGTTRDDAVGECFDKVAKILGLPYPGGPSIAKAALNGDDQKYQLPHPKVEGLDFSFSGLKTAVLRAVQKEVGVSISYPSHKLKELLSKQQVCDFAASFQRTAVEILIEKLKGALIRYPEIKTVAVAGGVSANTVLRERLNTCLGTNYAIYFPAPALSGDNGAMVAAACFFERQAGAQPVDPYTLNIYPRIPISE